MSDPTAKQRQNAYLERLEKAGGQRKQVDFSSEHVRMLDELINAGYARNVVDTIRKSIEEAHQREIPKRGK